MGNDAKCRRHLCKCDTRCNGLTFDSIVYSKLT